MGHFYEETNEGILPRHFVPMATRPDDLRPTRITDVKRMWKDSRNVVPSVTTIQNVLAKPALTNWLIDQHLKQSLKLAEWNLIKTMFDDDKSMNISEKGYLSKVKKLARKEMDKAPTAGSDIHKLLDDHCKGKLPIDTDPKMKALCENVYGVIVAKTKQREWKSEFNFVAKGYGGQIDLCNDGWVIDYKTKQTADKFKPGKMAFDNHAQQLSAYRNGIGQTTARCANVFICLEDGQIDFHEHSEQELDRGWNIFKHSLAIWQLQNGYKI